MKLLIFRTLLIYLCVLFAMRLMGKRQLGELQPEELVSTILISNLASISIESEEVPVTASLIPLFLIAALELLGSALSFRSQKFFNLMSGRPKTVILDGQIDQNALRTLRLTTADLISGDEWQSFGGTAPRKRDRYPRRLTAESGAQPCDHPLRAGWAGARGKSALVRQRPGLARADSAGQYPAAGGNPAFSGQRDGRLFSAEKREPPQGQLPVRGVE